MIEQWFNNPEKCKKPIRYTLTAVSQVCAEYRIKRSEFRDKLLPFCMPCGTICQVLLLAVKKTPEANYTQLQKDCCSSYGLTAAKSVAAKIAEVTDEMSMFLGVNADTIKPQQEHNCLCQYLAWLLNDRLKREYSTKLTGIKDVAYSNFGLKAGSEEDKFVTTTVNSVQGSLSKADSKVVESMSSCKEWKSGKRLCTT